MLLRRITTHVKDQNWFAVAVDFVIVVFGVVIGLQAQQWLVERDRRASEQQYLSRLHSDVTQLLASRLIYDEGRLELLAYAQTALKQLGLEDGTLDNLACTGIVSSSFTTAPPAALPTATELLSAGNLEAIKSGGVRSALLTYLQEAARAETLIAALSESNRDLTRHYPALFDFNYGPRDYALGTPDNNWLNPSCDAEAMRTNHAFMMELTENTYIYDVYTNRAILPISAGLKTLHAELDSELKTTHPEADEDT